MTTVTSRGPQPRRCRLSKRLALFLLLLNATIICLALFYITRLDSHRHEAPPINKNLRPCDSITDDWLIIRPTSSSSTADIATGDGVAWNFVVLDVGKQCNTGRRLGNQLFAVAAVVSAARLTRRQAVLPARCVGQFFEYFSPSSAALLRRADNNSRSAAQPVQQSSGPPSRPSPPLGPPSSSCFCYVFRELAAMKFDDRFRFNLVADAGARSAGCVVLDGYFQSWRYLELDVGTADAVRRLFTPSAPLRRYAADFLSTSADQPRPVLVGVHVRRADMTWAVHIRKGYSPPESGFYAKAMKYFTDRFPVVRFVVCSDDLPWAKKNVVVPDLPSRQEPDNVNETTSANSSTAAVSVTYCEGRSPGHDLVLLASCDHVIVSAGSFGWWAAWLANGTTLYYDRWPRQGTELSTLFTREDYYPPHWIPVSD